MVGDGRYIGQTKGKYFLMMKHMMRLSMSGIMYSETASDCPTGLSDWRYLDSELGWRDNGRISVTCAS